MTGREAVGSLKPDQLEALKFVLTPPQLENLTEIVTAEVTDEDHKKNTKR